MIRWMETQIDTHLVVHAARSTGTYFIKNGPALVGLCLSIFVIGCEQLNGSLQGTFDRTPQAVLDFQKTEIIADSAVAADGVSQILVGIHLKNSDNSAVPGYQPTYTIVSGSGVLPSNCTTSDKSGISACILKATVPGIKILRLTNAKVGLEKNVEFQSPSGAHKISLIPASQLHGTTSQGDSVQVSLGHPFQGGKLQSVDGYQIKFSMQGVATR